MATTIQYAEAGMAAYATEAFNEIPLFSGAGPFKTTTETLLNPGADLPAYSVVGRITASGKVTLCNPAAVDGSQVAIGITTAKVVNTAADQGIAIFREGTFNPAALNWHAGFTTDAQKRLAFEASQPGIIIQKIG